jgi:hypothetical protein
MGFKDIPFRGHPELAKRLKAKGVNVVESKEELFPLPPTAEEILEKSRRRHSQEQFASFQKRTRFRTDWDG